ncbi:hypothetical protein [Pontibacter anaerobius]|uniref:SWFGD domain-containing protein n=1 Tax=Pontibacter anaerobius TaxID=2993940 RepID=A0ABT3RJK3_9BACT|nr:hypothetical protein [Pontibacter anaerobius]MCX2741792.1 hypothetical protein [Pontibacter anaerobius]
MEGNYWNRNREDQNRDRNEPGRYPERQSRPNEDTYRGAYRFDVDSNHHNVSTWDWHSGPSQRQHQGDNYNQNYNRDYNRNYNRDYNRNYNEADRNRGYDHDNYNMDSRYRDQGDKHYRSGNYADWNDKGHFRNDDHTYQQGRRRHGKVHDRMTDNDPYGAGNFSADYGPDHYGQGGGENYGNEAGSLSFGYDGTSNYDPDWNTKYDPLSGHRRSYHGYYTSRHPEQNESRDKNNADRYGYGGNERY